MKASEIIHLFGGPTHVANTLEISPAAVSRWIKDDSIPKDRHLQLIAFARKNHLPISEDDFKPTIAQTNIKSLTPSSLISPILSKEESDKFVALIQLTYDHHFKSWNNPKSIPTPYQMAEAFVAFSLNPPPKYREVKLTGKLQVNPEDTQVKLTQVNPDPTF